MTLDNDESGKDLLNGGAGRDRLFGGSNRDQILGGAGGDQLIGQGGKDILIGGRGNDRIAGGRGRDTIVYTSLKDGTDTLIGFKITQDLIDLRQIFSDVAFAGESGDTDFQRFSNFVQLLEVNGSTEIRVDTDGSGSGTDTVTLAIAQATTGLTSENIVIS